MSRSNAPDFSHGFVRIPLGVWLSVFCKAPLTRRQLQLVAVVIRESWGWSDKGGGVRLFTRPMSPKKFAELSDLSTDRLSRDLKELLTRGVLQEQDGRYHFVPYPQQWTPKLPRWRYPATKQQALSDETSPGEDGERKRKKEKEKRSKSEWPQLSTIDPSPATHTPLIIKAVEVIQAFTGPLDAHDQENLTSLIVQMGIGDLWSALEPGLRAGPERARAYLLQVLENEAIPETRAPLDE